MEVEMSSSTTKTTDEQPRPATEATPDTPGVIEKRFDGEMVRRLAGHVVSSGGATESAIAPYTGEPLGALPRSTKEDVEEAFKTARAAQAKWAKVPPAERVQVLLRFHDLVLDRQDQVLDIIQLENGKTRKDAFLEVADMAITARYYGHTAASLLKPRRRRGALPGLTSTIEIRHPKGVIGLVSPWNYPLSLGAGDSLPALMAGNAIVQKPDNQTAFTALWAVDLMYEAGLPAGLWQVVLGHGKDIGPPLIGGADYVMFTGSTATGRTIARDAGERLIGCSLELGGKNAMLVLEDADLDRTAEGAVRACFSSSGQLCISIERMYVHKAVQEAFLDKFLRRVRAMRLGTGLDYTSDMGSLTSVSQLDTVGRHVDDAVKKGAKVLAGGNPRPDVGPLFYEPTVLRDVSDDMICHSDETFGPVVSIYPFGDVEEAIELANDTTYGLNASVWTKDAARGRELASRLHAGTVNVNEAYAAAWASIDAPMGGMGDSGLGRRHGAEGLLKYTEVQSIAHQRLIGFTPPGKMSYGAWASAMTASLRVMKRARLK
jgi:succinate-semialdehyde dehydrogenase/glutarate-semialdehyde dehydrogenase